MCSGAKRCRQVSCSLFWGSLHKPLKGITGPLPQRRIGRPFPMFAKFVLDDCLAHAWRVTNFSKLIPVPSICTSLQDEAHMVSQTGDSLLPRILHLYLSPEPLDTFMAGFSPAKISEQVDAHNYSPAGWSFEGRYCFRFQCPTPLGFSEAGLSIEFQTYSQREDHVFKWYSFYTFVGTRNHRRICLRFR